jgi:hypothetical protein
LIVKTTRSLASAPQLSRIDEGMKERLQNSHRDSRVKAPPRFLTFRAQVENICRPTDFRSLPPEVDHRPALDMRSYVMLDPAYLIADQELVACRRLLLEQLVA